MPNIRTQSDHPPAPWHTYAEKSVLEQLKSRLEGLNDIEVADRQKKFGLNQLPGKPPPGFVHIFISQFKNPLIYVLIVAAVVSFLLNEYTDGGFITAVLMLNAIIGSVQEWNAEKTAASLQQLLSISIKVRRNNTESMLEAERLVPGDIVFLESGDRVPADIRILDTNQISIDESLLTGESIAVEKTGDAVDEDLQVADRINMAYAGSTVMSGRGRGIVVATGRLTEVGNIARAVSVSTALKPPLVIRMERFARQIAALVLIATALLALIAYYKGFPIEEIFFFAVALAVSAVPEGLPVAITVALAIATKRMSKRNVIIRKLTAVEGLGSCTFIASDKTGTLTVNNQTVKRIVLPEGLEYEVTGQGYNGDGTIIGLADTEEPDDIERKMLNTVCTAGVICNESSLKYENDHWQYFGDAVDLSLMALSYKNGLDPRSVRKDIQITAELPFESERKFAATFYKENNNYYAVTKGAFEALIVKCDKMLTSKGIVGLDSIALTHQANELTQKGYRVIAIASAPLTQAIYKGASEDSIPPLTFLGLVGLIDPLRPEVKKAVQDCRDAGVDVAIVTGDHHLTALTIAKELGIADSIDQVITGKELESVSNEADDSFVEAVRGKKVFARVSPLQKMHIVESLNRLGNFVAVTGDGVNDVPALKKANIGVAMGSGTDLAKSTAEIIVTDDNFKSIEAGIEGGRFAYDNIRKVTYLLISTGASEIVLFLLSLMMGLPLPLAAVQLLWLNLVTNGIQDMALAFEGGEPEAMKRPPRKPTEGIFNNLMIQQTIVSGLAIGLIAFGTWIYLLKAGYNEFHARTLLLMLMVFLENVHVFNCRSEYISAFKVPLKRNWLIVAGVFAAQGIHILASNVPFMQKVLQTDAVTLEEWLTLFGLSIGVLAVMEIFKLFKKM